MARTNSGLRTGAGAVRGDHPCRESMATGIRRRQPGHALFARRRRRGDVLRSLALGAGYLYQRHQF